MKKPIKFKLPERMKSKNKGIAYALKYEYGQFLGEFKVVMEREDISSIYKKQSLCFRVECKDGREFIGESYMNVYGIQNKYPYLTLQKMEEKAFKELVREIETAYIKVLSYMDRKVRKIAPKTMASIQTGPNTVFEFETRKK